jgi:phenylpropionate dioxygenase-like ring-hydroxylating dioxygenase large terminal subunit
VKETVKHRSNDLDSPPPFAESSNRRQKARAAGMDPNYWYAVEYNDAVKTGQVIEVVFWKQSVALFRGADGKLRALENRCAHRQLKLSIGNVEDCRLVCAYHGWQYNEEGRVVDFSHDLFDKPTPQFRIRTYPVQVRYGLIWIFPGDPARASAVKIPDIPELEGADRWACVPVDFTWQAHHSMIIDNVSDFTHAYLHRKYRPFEDAKLTKCETSGDKVFVSYDTKVGRGKISGLFVDRDKVNTNHMDLCYEYPYQWSNTDDKIKHWCFILPIHERLTRVFFLFYFDALKIPFTPIRIPQRLLTVILKISNRVLIRPLLAEDGVAVEAEQQAFDAHFNAPPVELNPAINHFQQLTVRKWEEFLARSANGSKVEPQACAAACVA